MNEGDETFMKRKIGNVAICLFFTLLFAPTLVGQENIRRGIELFKESRFPAALEAFKTVLAEPSLGPFHGDAFFWTAKADAALGRYGEASRNLEHFLKNFPENPYIPEGKYEKGRLLHLQGEHEGAIIVLEEFLSRYPESEYAPNAYYWMGEALFALGDLKNAERMFSTVSLRYPGSFRAEAAGYRLALLGLRYREEELLKLLKWSHEEHLKALEDSQKNEIAYAESLKAYQRKLSALEVRDSDGEVLRLTEKVRSLEEQLRKAVSEPAVAPEGAGGADGDGRVRALEVKEEALRLKEFYLDRLIREYEGKR